MQALQRVWREYMKPRPHKYWGKKIPVAKFEGFYLCQTKYSAFRIFPNIRLFLWKEIHSNLLIVFYHYFLFQSPLKRSGGLSARLYYHDFGFLAKTVPWKHFQTALILTRFRSRETLSRLCKRCLRIYFFKSIHLSFLTGIIRSHGVDEKCKKRMRFEVSLWMERQFTP